MLSYMLPGEGKSSSPGMHQHVHQTLTSQQKSRLQLDLDKALESSQNSAPKMTPIIRTVEVSETRYKELRHPVTGQVLDASRDQHVQEMVFSDPQALRDRLEKTMIKQTNSGQVPFERTTYIKTQTHPPQFTVYNNNNTSEKSPYNQISGYGLGGVIKQQPPLSNEINRQFINNESISNKRQNTSTNATDAQKMVLSNNESSSSNRYFNDSGVSTGDEESGSAVGGTATSPSASDTGTPLAHNAGKKLLQGGGKPGLKRVSFGSSKGSMVETLVYESPVGGALIEEPEFGTERTAASQDDSLQEGEDTERSRVRVTFYQSSRPQCVSPALSGSPDLVNNIYYTTGPLDTPVTMTAVYDRQISNESGWDNPFRPDGELSREADAIVSLIKGGQPITPVAGEPPSSVLNSSALSNNSSPVAVANGNATVTDGAATNGGGLIKKDNATTLSSAAPATASSPHGKNGTVSPAKGGPNSPVAVQRGTVPQQSSPQQAELVVLKKKPKCKCCVIQ